MKAYENRFGAAARSEFVMALKAKGEQKREVETMDVLDAIHSRRSVRHYAQRQVDAEKINQLLNAAIRAPSSMNKQPWAFVVIQNEEFLARLNRQAKDFLKQSPTWRQASEHVRGLMDPNFDIFYGASTLIVIYAEKHGFEPIGDCYLAGANLMLAATGLGLGTCAIGFARDVLRSVEIHKELGLGDSYVPVLPIIVGYTTEYLPPTPRSPPRVLNWLQ